MSEHDLDKVIFEQNSFAEMRDRLIAMKKERNEAREGARDQLKRADDLEKAAKIASSEHCDLCGIRNKEKVEYRLCQHHMNECVIGERDMKAERDTWNKIANKMWHSWLTARKERDEARAFAQKQYDRAEVAERRADLLSTQLNNSDRWKAQGCKREMEWKRRAKVAEDYSAMQESRRYEAEKAAAAWKKSAKKLRKLARIRRNELLRTRKRAEKAEKRVDELETKNKAMIIHHKYHHEL